MNLYHIKFANYNRIFFSASTEQYTTELKPTEKSANNEIDNLEESFEVATPNLEKNDVSKTIEDQFTTETFK